MHIQCWAADLCPDSQGRYEWAAQHDPERWGQAVHCCCSNTSSALSQYSISTGSNMTSATDPALFFPPRCHVSMWHYGRAHKWIMGLVVRKAWCHMRSDSRALKQCRVRTAWRRASGGPDEWQTGEGCLQHNLLTLKAWKHTDHMVLFLIITKQLFRFTWARH